MSYWKEISKYDHQNLWKACSEGIIHCREKYTECCVTVGHSIEQLGSLSLAESDFNFEVCGLCWRL